MRAVRTVVVSVCLAAAPMGMPACGSRDEAPADRHDRPAQAALTSTPRIVMLGDSLTAGLGLDADEAYPALIQQRLKERGLAYEVVNAGVSGDTSAGGLSRLDWALEGNVKVLVVALGANDGLRGLPIDELNRNLSQIIERAQARRVAIVLVGMEAPPNFGDRYTAAFHGVFPAISRQYRVPLVPFLLQGVAAVDALNQRDGIHPNRRGAAIVADNVWTVLEPALNGRTVRD